MLTVACVFKSRTAPRIGGKVGSLYDATWVQKLQRGVARHLHVPHRFVCLTDAFVPGVEVIPLVHGWDGWWSKVELFRPGALSGPVLYLDLDTLVVNDITDMAGPFDGMVMLEDAHPGVINSTAMWWNADNPLYATIYHRFLANVAGEARSRQGIAGLGDQALIVDVLNEISASPTTWQSRLGHDGFVPFSFHSALHPGVKDGLPPGARLVYCLGDPKFPTYPDFDFIREHWV